MVYREKIPRVQSLNTAVVEFLRTNIPDLDGRVHSGITPEGESFPSAVVDVASQHDAHLGLDVGLERAGITVRCQTEELADDDDASADLADLTATVSDALVGRSGPELELDGYEILDVARAGSRSYAESVEGRRVLYEAAEFDVTLERKRA